MPESSTRAARDPARPPALPLTRKSALSESLGGQTQGASSPGQLLCLKRVQRRGWPPSGSPEGSPPEAPVQRCGASKGNHPSLRTAPCPDASGGL